VVVFGQGVIGLLTTALLAHYPLSTLVTLDRYELRRETSLALGAHSSLDPESGAGLDRLRAALDGEGATGADLVYELSGTPSALDQAVAVTGFSGRIVVGSWYGLKKASLDLGGHFHRQRVRLVSSQVSTLSPEHTGRWTKARRLLVAWDTLAHIEPSRWITHRFPVEKAGEAYRLLDQNPGQTLQVVLTY
jgi:threonine dehydrogenase-like Zn-dependent dehydrogenase